MLEVGKENTTRPFDNDIPTYLRKSNTHPTHKGPLHLILEKSFNLIEKIAYDVGILKYRRGFPIWCFLLFKNDNKIWAK